MKYTINKNYTTEQGISGIIRVCAWVEEFLSEKSLTKFLDEFLFHVRNIRTTFEQTEIDNVMNGNKSEDNVKLDADMIETVLNIGSVLSNLYGDEWNFYLKDKNRLERENSPLTNS